jgi:FkbM family methyltransferase
MLQGLKRVVPAQLKDLLRFSAGKPAPFGLTDTTRNRLTRLPRKIMHRVSFRGKPLILCDAASFLAAHDEIFIRQSYAFRTNREAGVIIDAGANIGIASLWFSTGYPNFHVIAIEADPAICKVLGQNIDLQQATNVTVMHRAVWDNDDELLSFSADGADGGHVLAGARTTVRSIRLKHLLEAQPVEMLKIDIEGAEIRVLQDCRAALENVNNIFIEFHSFTETSQRLSLLLDILEESGFRYYIENPGPFSVHPLLSQQSDAGHDLRINIWARRNGTRDGS